MAQQSSFKLPRSFLTQLGEFTTGYVLVAVNEQGEFETFIQADTPIIRLGLGKFLAAVSDTLDQAVSASFHNITPTPTARPGDEEDGSVAT